MHLFKRSARPSMSPARYETVVSVALVSRVRFGSRSLRNSRVLEPATARARLWPQLQPGRLSRDEFDHAASRVTY